MCDCDALRAENRALTERVATLVDALCNAEAVLRDAELNRAADDAAAALNGEK
jgi:hypothetical protein